MVQRTQQRLHDELETIDAKVREIRAWFDGWFDDVVGVELDEESIRTPKYESSVR